MKRMRSKQIILGSFCLAASLFANAPAFADAQDARVFGVEAANLLKTASDLQSEANTYPTLDPIDMPQTFISKLQTLGMNASRLSREIEDMGGPSDFQCIFRGMAKETGDQLNMIHHAQNGGEQADALERLVSMLDDARMVSEAAALAFEDKQPVHTPSTSIGSCSVQK